MPHDPLQRLFSKTKAEQFWEVLGLDVSPLRPHEFASLPDAYLWHEARQLRKAYDDGVQDARDQHAAGKAP